jgi:hypothetical protein
MVDAFGNRMRSVALTIKKRQGPKIRMRHYTGFVRSDVLYVAHNSKQHRFGLGVMNLANKLVHFSFVENSPPDPLQPDAVRVIDITIWPSQYEHSYNPYHNINKTN